MASPYRKIGPWRETEAWEIKGRTGGREESGRFLLLKVSKEQNDKRNSKQKDAKRQEHQGSKAIKIIFSSKDGPLNSRLVMLILTYYDC